MTAPPANDQAAESPALERRFKRVTIGLIAVYLLLALTHGGEFWPFSRFVMFARAAKPWLRGTLRELPAEQLAQPLPEVGERELPGKPFPLVALGIDQNDLSELIRNMKGPLDEPELTLLAPPATCARQALRPDQCVGRARGCPRSPHRLPRT